MKRSSIIIIHVIFWIIVFALYYSFLIFGGSRITLENYIYTTVKALLEFCTFYAFYLIIIPLFFKRGRYWICLLTSLLFIFLYIHFYAAIITYTSILIGFLTDWTSYGTQVMRATYYVVLFSFLGGLFKLSLNGLAIQQQKTLLEKQNIKNELALLRSQINPHFLFNTLNTIHSYIISNNPRSAQAVIRLSDIMRYMLYDASRDMITLVKEIEYLQGYIELQKFRLESEVQINFNIAGDPDGISISPMLLTPFVENVFKHGKKSGLEDPISIELKIGDKHFEFSVSNSVDSLKTYDTEKNEGVGLENVRRRLHLLYPKNHTLDIKELDNKFFVYLKINFE